MSASPLPSPFHPSHQHPCLFLPSLILLEQQKPSRRQWQVTLWMKGPDSNGCHSAQQRSQEAKGKKGFSWKGMEGGEEGAEVEMWTEVAECRPQGSEPLIDCSRLTEVLCDCHLKHTPSLCFYSCEGLLRLSLPLTLILTETLYKF